MLIEAVLMFAMIAGEGDCPARSHHHDFASDDTGRGPAVLIDQPGATHIVEGGFVHWEYIQDGKCHRNKDDEPIVDRNKAPGSADPHVHVISGKDEDGHHVTCLVGKDGIGQCFGD